ncbi:unannotated protein [freshwater metagenome]|uniref:Unannotated protein n=1 Tax=freshwater metagenome TaxID=449393 RepID=A0A6J7QQ20_9ZZZZ|nr:hypothetical protein [Actinomycetota bacterium]MSX15897.1 hypothetical protein [Actinomycetota bacterium]MSX77559.1 hypothetical protein [Actinomycetota bacterium]MSZ72247.1 hypothetical protein [Actinomycetota bacterium]MUH55432.1 hypothetical protein [Actinomycetota bacterium]
MRILRAFIGRLTGRDMRALRAEVAEMRNQIQVMNDILQSFNHDIRSGSERSLPLFMGYAERLRLDADTAVGATQVIDRQIAQLQQRLDQLSVPNQG